MGAECWHVVSFSGGKDSTALLLRMLELGMQIDEIIFCDTTVEFPAMYRHIDQVEQYIGRKITRLCREHSWEYMCLEHMKKNGVKGYSFPDMRNRWCTAYFKNDNIRRHLAPIRKQKKVIEYVGIAFDERQRAKGKTYPLIEWQWTEADCLAYCRSKGFDWGGLYDKVRRLSCWCCPLQRINDFRVLRKEFPALWGKLLDWQGKTWRNFTADNSAFDLERRFAAEDCQLPLFVESMGCCYGEGITRQGSTRRETMEGLLPGAGI